MFEREKKKKHKNYIVKYEKKKSICQTCLSTSSLTFVFGLKMKLVVAEMRMHERDTLGPAAGASN